MRRLLWLLLPLCAAWANQAPVFDVASLKPSPPPDGDTLAINLGAARHGTLTMTNVTLSECIRWAYHLISEEQVTGPVWINERATRFDISAKTSPDTAQDQMRFMLRSLLSERFGLKMHNEQRRIDHYELTVSKTGPKLEHATGDTLAFRTEYNRGHLAYSQIPMDTLAILLARQLKQLVLNETHLAGYYNVKLDWTPDDAPVGDATGVDITTAVRQLGLNLEMKKTPVEVYVVDRAEKSPLGN